jgi:hypothetical protein
MAHWIKAVLAWSRGVKEGLFSDVQAMVVVKVSYQHSKNFGMRSLIAFKNSGF